MAYGIGVGFIDLSPRAESILCHLCRWALGIFRSRDDAVSQLLSPSQCRLEDPGPRRIDLRNPSKSDEI